MHRSVRGAVQPALEEERMQEGMQYLLQCLQMRAWRHLRQQGDMREVLHRLDHARQQDQMPLILINKLASILNQCWFLGTDLGSYSPWDC